MSRNGLLLLRITLGIVFFWFGFLKFFPGVSTAEDIAGKTIYTVSFGLIKPQPAMYILACWECAIGIGFLAKKFMVTVLALMWVQMLGTLMPLIIYPAETWAHPFVPSLLGQYIIKNFVLIAAGIVLGGTIYGRIVTTRSEAVHAAREMGEQEQS